MTRSELASYIDHTVLKPDTRAAAIEKLCAEALQYQFAAVCVAPRWVPLCAKMLKDSEVHVATVLGFPHGDTLSRAKAEEAKAAIEAGATEVDMVISIGAALDGDWRYVHDDIAAVVLAAKGHALIKVIMETSYLTSDQIVAACRAAKSADADYVKTSTGFASGGATVENVRLMRQTVGEGIGVKASGGIRDLQTALTMIEAGASRLGCSASVAIVNELGALKVRGRARLGLPLLLLGGVALAIWLLGPRFLPGRRIPLLPYRLTRPYGMAPAAFDALLRACNRAKIQPNRIGQTIGNHPRSFGYHKRDGAVLWHGQKVDYCAAVDLGTNDLTRPQIARFLEALAAQGFAAFYREKGKWKGFEHIHAIYAPLKMKWQLQGQVREWEAKRQHEGKPVYKWQKRWRGNWR